ncbi:MAG: hypothetical protein JJ969_02710 [Rhizobiaceae bacterium]|nr:hypothetical protein [Rhizobiaceae bacterium]
MGKSTKKPEAAAEPKKRSKLILGLVAAAPLVLGAGGYAVWAFYLATPDAVEAHAAEGGETDDMKVAAVPREIMAESSFTHSYALSVLVREKCGPSDAPALRQISNAEAAEDGLLAQLSWEAAARRTQLLKAKSCGYLLGEIADADAKATEALAEMEAGKAKGH